MEEYILRENVLTNNVLKIPSKGKIFKGGYIAIIREYTYLNAWQDKESVRRFRSIESLFKYLRKSYSERFEELDSLIEIEQL